MTDEPPPGGTPRQDVAAGASPDVPADTSIDDYLRANAGRYTFQALDAQLRQAGHSEDAIAMAWRRLHPPTSPAAPAPPPPGLPGFLRALAVLAIVLVYGGSALAAGIAMLAGATGGGGGRAVVLLAYTVGVIVAAVWCFRLLRRADGSRRRLLAVFGAIGITAVLWVALSGLCIAGLSSSGVGGAI
jgi:hypothetical protein